MNPSLEQEIRTLRSLFWSQRDPEGLAFAPLADAYRRAGDFRHALELLRDGLDRHPGFLSGHVVAAQLYLEKGLLEEAEIAGRRALELDRENVIAAGLVADAEAAKRVRDGEVAAEAPPEVPAEAPVEEADTAAEEGALEEPIVEIAALAPEPEPGAEGVELPALAPEEPVVDIAALAPEEPALEAAGPAPEEQVVDIAMLAPVEPVEEFVAVAPEEPVEAVVAVAPEEAVVDIAALAPDEPVLEAAAPAREEPVLEAAAPAPEEQVLEVAALAPEPSVADADLPSDELPEEESLVTRTMAELYARQGLNDRALDVYRQLLEAAPGDEGLLRRTEELEALVQGSSEAAETPFAWTEEETPEAPAAGPTIATYFEGLLAWTPRSPTAPEEAPSSGSE